MVSVEDTRAVLAALTGLDPRFYVADEATAEMRARMWTEALANCPLDFAMKFITHAYRSPRPSPVQVGEIRQAWIEEDERRQWRAAKVRNRASTDNGLAPEYLRREMRNDIARGQREFEAQQRAIAERNAHARREKVS